MKQEEKVKYNIELLNETIIRDDAQLIGEYDKLNRDKRITFICKCGKEGTKTFRLMVSKGTLCKDCIKELKIKNTKDTILRVYGVEHLMHSDEIKNKIKTTNLEKYGVEHAMQRNDVKEKFTQTILNKYGAEHTFKVPEIKEKCNKTILNKYKVDNAFKNEDIKQKIKTTNLQKYGVEHVSQRSDVKEKVKHTIMTRYGVTHHLQLKHILQKQWNTNMNKYNIKHCFHQQFAKEKSKEQMKINKYSINEKKKRTCLIKYGTNHHLQNKNIFNKLKQTNFKKYGVFHNAQSAEIRHKQEMAGYKFKQYKMPSGNIRKLQGYEPFAIDELIQIYNEEQIKTGSLNVPRIKYSMNYKEHYYFPDIYIPHENKLIEVKSSWTYNKYLETNKAKANEALAQGYNFEIWIYDAKKNKTILTDFN